MVIFKQFLQSVCQLSTENVYLRLSNEILPHISTYITYLLDIKLEEGLYHTFYGDIKNVVFGFLTYFDSTINDMVKEVNSIFKSISREELLHYLEKSLDIINNQQLFFGKNFLPVCTSSEKETYEEINNKFEQAKTLLTNMKPEIEKLDKQSSINIFVKQHFTTSLKEASKLFNFTHEFMSKIIAERVQDIRVSLEDILQRSKKNLKEIQKQSEDEKHDLLHKLYDTNKNYLHITRQMDKNTIEASEVSYTIQTLRDKIEESRNITINKRIEEELNYWENRVEEFNQLAEQLLKLKAEQENVRKQEAVYNQLRTTELPGSKSQCWLTIGDNLIKRRQYLNVKIDEVSKAFVTFFVVRGNNHILHENDIGKFFVDSFNHKVYPCNYGMNSYHRKRNGEFIEFSEKDKYYFDNNGRYIQENDAAKVYQCAPCTSTYKLGDCKVLEKNFENPRNDLQDIKEHIVQILPTTEMKNIKGTLNSETVKYLWDCFGHILPEALKDVGMAQPKNPIQYLAHKLLLYKYNKTMPQQTNQKKEAEEFRAKILKDRKEKAIAASKAWRAQQVKCHKSKDADDAEQHAVVAAHFAAQAHVASLNYYYD
ncbi:hypothetical protein ACJJTC_005419 [Scirpophaga incertulas]